MLEIPILEYINTPEDHWVVCLEVPYGTALWQVGISKEQNDSFNIAFVKGKHKLLSLKNEKDDKIYIFKTYRLNASDNIVGMKALVDLIKISKLLKLRGLNAFSFNLLLDHELRAPMPKLEVCTNKTRE